MLQRSKTQMVLHIYAQLERNSADAPTTFFDETQSQHWAGLSWDSFKAKPDEEEEEKHVTICANQTSLAAFYLKRLVSLHN